jgi:hypothetical protein
VIALTLAPLTAWRGESIVNLAICLFAAGMFLVECLLKGWSKTPFACAHAADAESVRSRWLIGLVAFLAFAYGGAGLAVLASASLRGVAIFLTVAGSAIVLLRVAQRWGHPGIELQFDLETSERLTLNLSEAAQ